MTSGQRIKAARKAAGLTQQELADRLHVSFVNISQYENDKRNPKLETLRKIAAAIGVPDYELIGDNELDKPDAPKIRDLFSSKNWDRWVDKDMNPIFSSREEFEEWSKDFDPNDPPLLTDYFIVSDEKQKKPASGEDGLDELDKQLMEIIKTLSHDQKVFLLAQLQTLKANLESR